MKSNYSCGVMYLIDECPSVEEIALEIWITVISAFCFYSFYLTRTDSAEMILELWTCDYGKTRANYAYGKTSSVMGRSECLTVISSGWMISI